MTVIYQHVQVRRIGDRHDRRRDAQQWTRSSLMPFIAPFLAPDLMAAPVGRKILQSDVLYRHRVRQFICDHDEFRHKRWILDMDELLKNTQGRRRGAVCDRMADGVPASVKVDAVYAIERLCTVFP